MNCLEARQILLTDPYHLTDELEGHLRSCTNCEKFKQEVLDLDSNVDTALNIQVPEGLAARILLAQSLSAKKTVPAWLNYGVAASIALALVVASWFVVDSQSGRTVDVAESEHGSHPRGTKQELVTLQSTEPEMAKPEMTAAAIDMVAGTTNPFLIHAAHQPHEFYGAEHEEISAADLELLMNKLNLTASIDKVVYAAICPLGDESAAHLVIKDGNDQYTVMLLPERSPSQMYAVDDTLWRGFISPHPAGALAVLADVEDTSALLRLNEVTDKLKAAIYLSAER